MKDKLELGKKQEMNCGVELVDYQVALSIKVGQFLQSKGFDLASSGGTALDMLSKRVSIGILYKNTEERPKMYLFGLIKREPRRIFLGVVWFNNSTLNATEQNWFFEAYGSKNVDLVLKLAGEMRSTFNIKISVCLMYRDSRFETYSSDHAV